jgi:nucleotide-binding universal stress UspA family protein
MIPQIKKILYATDLTKNSSYAAYFAADLARKHDAKVVIFHCIAPIHPAIYYEIGIPDEDGTLRVLREQEKVEVVAEIRKRLQELYQKIESEIGSPCVGLVSDVIIVVGYPVEEILNAAEGCDVIVLGTHGKGWLKQTFLGSVARSVLERTRKPVLIIPLPSDKSSVNWAAI